jgi:hypothetical protein
VESREGEGLSFVFAALHRPEFLIRADGNSVDSLRPRDD